MKKFLKAVALATVMCMLLSTVAFAAAENVNVPTGSENFVESVTKDTDGKIITANIKGVGANEQVVLIIIANDADLATAEDGDIMFIDQTKANGNGEAEFANIKILDPKATVDVYVGSAETDGAKLVADDISLEKVDAITYVSDITTEVKTGEDGSKAIASVLTVNVPDGFTITKMIWAISTMEDTTEVRRYSKPFNATEGEAVTGGVQFGAVFKTDNIILADDPKVGAIFLTTEAEEQFTHPNLDAKNEAPGKTPEV